MEVRDGLTLGCQVWGVANLGECPRGRLHPSSLWEVPHSLNLGLDFCTQTERPFRRRITSLEKNPLGKVGVRG